MVLAGRLLLTERGAVLKVWEGYFKNLLNRKGSNGELELPCFVDRKVELVEITEKEVWMTLKTMKKGRAPGIYEVCTEVVIALEEFGVSWVKRLLKIRMSKGSILEG